MNYSNMMASEIVSLGTKSRKNKEPFDYKKGFAELLKKDRVGTHIVNAGRDWPEFDYKKAQKAISVLDERRLDKGKLTLLAGELWEEFDYEKGLDTLIKLDSTGGKVFDAQSSWKKYNYNKALKFLKEENSTYYDVAIRIWPKGRIQEGAMNNNNLLLEMAANHMDNEMLDSMLSGNIEAAVNRYINNMVAKKATVANTSSAVTKKIIEKRYPKSLKVDKDKLEKIPTEYWKKFDEVYKETVAGTKKPEKKDDKPAKLKGSVTTTKEGEEIVFTAGRTQKEIKDDLSRKLIGIIHELEEKLDIEEEKEKLNDISEKLRGLYIMLEALNATRRGKGLLDYDPKELEKKYKKIASRYKQVNIKEETELSEVMKLMDELISVTTNSKEKERYVSMKAKLEEILKETNIKEEKELDFYYDFHLRSLIEALEYRGSELAENYFYSAFAQSFRKDVDEYGLEEATEMYKIIYGDEITLMTEAITEDKEFFEAIKGLDTTLIFEGYTLKENMTTTVWGKLNNFGSKALGRLATAFSRGAGWAKQLFKKGASFFTGANIAKIAIPSIVIAGSVSGAVAMINKLRKKAKQNPLSKEELEKFKEEVKKNGREVNQYR